MLNELYALSQALEHQGLLQPTVHPDISSVGKQIGLLIEIDQHGVPVGVRYLEKEEMGRLWKHSKGNHNSFPAICVHTPLLPLEICDYFDRNKWKKSKLLEKIKTLSALDLKLDKNANCPFQIGTWTQEQLAEVKSSTQPQLAALRQLLNVFPHADKAVGFGQQLLDLIKEQLERCDDEALVDLFKELFVGQLNPNEKQREKKPYICKVMTYFEVREAHLYANLVGSDVTRRSLIDLLQEKQEQTDTVVSPFETQLVKGIGRKYPNPVLPVLGQTYLYSKKETTTCLERYQLSGSQAFQAGREEVDKMNNALAFLTAAERENKTWRRMTDAHRNKPALLLAYVAQDPQNDACLAQILGDLSDYEISEDFQAESAGAYEALCAQVLQELKLIRDKNKDSQIHLMLLGELDLGRKQVVYEQVWQTELFCSNLLRWLDASKNAPGLDLPMIKKRKVQYLEVKCVEPAEICQLFKMNYSSLGLTSSSTSVVTINEIYDLYMPQNPQTADQADLIFHLLEIALAKSMPFLSVVFGERMVNDQIAVDKTSRNQAETAARWLGLFGILLALLEIKKENYMKDVPFQLGQMLKLSDMLHKEYCFIVRNKEQNKSYPAQLIGNDLLFVMADNPLDGYQRLAERLRIYWAWAYTYQGEREKWVKWILSRLEDVNSQIALGEISETLDPAQKAQLMIGYYARIENTRPQANTMNKEETKHE